MDDLVNANEFTISNHASPCKKSMFAIYEINTILFATKTSSQKASDKKNSPFQPILH